MPNDPKKLSICVLRVITGLFVLFDFALIVFLFRQPEPPPFAIFTFIVAIPAILLVHGYFVDEVTKLKETKHE